MTQEIKLVQGFKGNFPYTLNFNGTDINVLNTTVHFNFTDRREAKRYSILCNQGSKPNEVIIPFEDETSDYGEYFGEFVVKSWNATNIYPVEDRIHIKIRKCV